MLQIKNICIDERLGQKRDSDAETITLSFFSELGNLERNYFWSIGKTVDWIACP